MTSLLKAAVAEQELNILKIYIEPQVSNNNIILYCLKYYLKLEVRGAPSPSFTYVKLFFRAFLNQNQRLQFDSRTCFTFKPKMVLCSEIGTRGDIQTTFSLFQNPHITAGLAWQWKGLEVTVRSKFSTQRNQQQIPTGYHQGHEL